MGVGKTTIGEALANRLGWAYLDSDEQVHAATGRTVKEISMEEGPETLHRFEDAALAAALQSSTSAVVAVAGGALLVEANRVLLKEQQHVIWLRATLENVGPPDWHEGRPAVLRRRPAGDHPGTLRSAPPAL